MTARQDEIEVHELGLDGTELKEEDFLTQGSGSHFESRVAELVVLIPSPEGIARLPDKVEQLVAKGFHNIVVALGELESLEAEAIESLSRSRQVVDTWAGSLRLSEANNGVSSALSALQGDEAFEAFSTRSEAIDAYRATMNQAPLDPGESQDLLMGSGDDVTAATEEDPNNWGWGAEEEGDASAAFPTVPIAEVFAEDSELVKLDNELRRVLMGGKKHVSLRLSFSRPLTSDDVDNLIGARDYLKREGGQLALVSLPLEILKRLRMLDLEREFLIVESAADAEQAHQRHANGEEVTSGPSPVLTPQAAPAPAPAPALAAEPAPAPAPAPTEEPSLDPVSSVELDSGITFGSDISIGPADEGGADPAELARLRADCDAARSEVARLQAEQSALQGRLQQAQSERDQAHLTLNELQTSLRRSERQVAELEQAQSRAERRAVAAEEARDQVQEGTRRLDGEMARLRQDLDQAREKAQELEAASANAPDPARVQELEAEIAARDAKIQSLEQAAAASSSGPAAASGDLAQRCQALEEEKARILTEAEAEIQRLADERQLLREELESAGEMIERLGKELELS